MRCLALVLVLVLVGMLGGCSFITHSRARSPESCNPSRLAPGFDTYNAVGGGALALAALSEFDDGSDRDLGVMIAATSLTLGTIHAVAASYGFKHARACREVRAAHEPPPPAILVPVEGPPPIVIEEDEETTTTTTTTRTKRTIIVP